MPQPIRVLLVDDDPLVRSALRLLLGSAPDLEVVGEAGDGSEVDAAVTTTRPHVVLMDLRMPGVDGIVATTTVRARNDAPHVIALTTWDVDEAVLRALEAGAAGFLLKSASPTQIIDAVRAVVDGDAVLSPRSTRQLLDHLAASEFSSPRADDVHAVRALSEREASVAAAVGRGLTNAEIAAELFISEATVKTHLASAQTKLGVRNRVGVAVIAERAGLVQRQ